MNVRRSVAVLGAVCIASVASAQYSISSFTIDGGGISLSGATYSLSGTVGQTDATNVQSGVTYDLTGGFWPGAGSALCEGDANGDGVVDVNDISYVIFRLGMSGTPGTVDGDANGDGVTDVNDISYVIFRLGPCP